VSWMPSKRMPVMVAGGAVDGAGFDLELVDSP
jgi:hypothetical protein